MNYVIIPGFYQQKTFCSKISQISSMIKFMIFSQLTKLLLEVPTRCLLFMYISGSDRILVFVETKRNADFLASYLSQEGFPTTSIHG